MWRGVTVVACFALCALIASPTAAQAPGPAKAATSEPRPHGKAAADALFKQAIALMKARQFAAACRKFAASHQLDPTSGTAFNLARCFQVTDRPASAWRYFREAETIANKEGKAERAQAARAAYGSLAPQLSKLVIIVDAANRSPDFTVRLDGEPVAPARWAKPIPVDPGPHLVEATAAGRQAFNERVNITALRQIETVTIGPLAKLATTVPEPGSTQPRLPQDPPKEPRRGATQRLAGYLVGAAGVIGLAIGVGFGISAIDKNAASKDYCDPIDPNVCNDEGITLRDEAFDSATVATVAFIVGSVAIGTGLTLLLTAPSDTEPDGEVSPSASSAAAQTGLAAELAIGLGGIALRGRW